MIGLPLRLLAREVYARVVEKAGVDAVALVTGEEKIKPARPRFWVCTVEAMPRDLAVDFVAIDEVQLAADLDRGHVFTDRLLNRRGRAETMLIGAGTMKPVIEQLIPGVNVVTRPRLSQLLFAGDRKITRLAPRSRRRRRARSIAARLPEITICPGALSLATTSSVGPATASTAACTTSRSRPITAAMPSDPDCRDISLPRRTTIRSASDSSRTPAATTAAYSPMEWPATNAGASGSPTACSRAAAHASDVVSRHGWVCCVSSRRSAGPSQQSAETGQPRVASAAA